MIKKIAPLILPFLLTTLFLLEGSGILHVGYLYIKSHELKWTDLDYNYFPREGDIFTAGESVSNNNYEDAVFAFRPDYHSLLQKDLDEISANRDYLDTIDGERLSFYSGEYEVKVCLEKKDISIKDSTLFKKLVNVEILGQYELYDRENGDLLLLREGEKFWIRDKIILRGRARAPFITNKINEIWMAQMSNNAHQIISYFEAPRIFRARINAIKLIQLFGAPHKVDLNIWEDEARYSLYLFDEKIRARS